MIFISSCLLFCNESKTLQRIGLDQEHGLLLRFHSHRYMDTGEQMSGAVEKKSTISKYCAFSEPAHTNSLNGVCLSTGGGGGLLLGIFGGGVPPASPNPDQISDQNNAISSIHKAREAFLIQKGRTIDPNGLNIREETY